MEILFDLQSYLQKSEPDTVFVDDFLLSYGDFPPTLQVLEEDGVKFINTSGREHNSSGVLIRLDGLEDIDLGYRIVITGRIDKTAPKEGWGICLTVDFLDPDGQLDQDLNPHGIYVLSHVFDKDNCKKELFIYTKSWKDYLPTMNFTIDNIIISKFASSKRSIKDDRVLLYSMEEHKDIQDTKIGLVLNEDMGILRRAGHPSLIADAYGGRRIIRIDNRTKDYDGIDIVIEHLKLLPDNEYDIKITGQIEGETPEGSQITFQTLPGFNWRSTRPIQSGTDFEMYYKISKHNIGRLTEVRLTTNQIGAKAIILIHSIEITVG